ncbi:MAG: TonB-dependent receptor, partial [Novosphingobium sp.]
MPSAALAQANQTGDAQLPQNELPQNQTPDQAAEANIATQAQAGGEPIVVTGTLIRGIAPAGNNVIGISTEQVAATGGATTNQILNSLPQVGNFFNALPAGVSGQSGANLSNPISRPNLRNLPAANTSGGAQTLVLVDGHRVVGAGIQQIAVDPDIIAPGVIERVEALTDGGSAVYGSDALGGVLNFITRKKFDGVQAAARYGFGDDYYTVDGSVMVGKDWGTGGIYAAYGYAHHDAVYGLDRDFVFSTANGLPDGVATGRNCPTANVTVGGQPFIPSGTGLASGFTACDTSDNAAIYPVNTLHTAFGRLTQDLSDSITFDVSALYASRKIRGNGGTLGTGALGSGAAGQATLCPIGTVTAGCLQSAFYRPAPGLSATASETVRFDYTPLFGPRAAIQPTDLESYSVTPSLSIDLGSGFQLRTLFSYGRAFTEGRNAQISTTAQATALAAGTLNPFNVGATSPDVAARLLQTQVSRGRNELWDYRAIVDGPLFSIGGGDVRIAAGAERLHNRFQLRTTNTNVVPYTLNNPLNYSQKVNAVFGEVQVPLISRENEISGFKELTVSGSARYDDYSDVGGTFNPKVGVTWRPVNWVAVRGNLGKSFNAPTAVDFLNVLSTTVNPVPSQFLTAVGQFNPVAGETGVFVGGTDPGITPQKATNYSFGIEVKPPFLEGLTASVSYYHIKLKGTIGRPVTGADLTSFFAGYPSLFQVRPSGQQLAAYLAQFNPANVNIIVTNPMSASQAIISSGGNASPVLVVLDTRARNLGVTNLSGIDFAVNYLHETGFGSIDASFAGNYKIKQKTLTEPGVSELNDLFLQSTPRLLFQATLGATIGNFRAQASLAHTAGYKRGDAFLLTAQGTPTTTPNAAAFGQTRVSAFDAVNLYFRYEVPEGLLGP